MKVALLLSCLAVGSSLSLDSPVATITVDVKEVALGDWYTVTWAGVAAEHRSSEREAQAFWKDEKWDVLTTGCWVGQYPVGANLTTVPTIAFPADQPLTATAPWRYVDCDTAAAFATTGGGSFNFTMDAKIRTDVFFALFTGGYDTPKVLAVSPPLLVSDKALPGHVHLVRARDPSVMHVQWNSAFNESQAVRLTHSDGSSIDIEASSITTIVRSDFCGEPANSTGFIDSGFFYDAVVTGLVAGSKYTYSVGSAAHGRTQDFSFVGPKPVDPHGDAFVLMLADQGTTYMDGSKYHWMESSAQNTTSHLIDMTAGEQPVDLVLHAGDISYATGYQSKWDRFMTAVEPLAAYVPYMTGKGNHEQDSPQPPIGQVKTFYPGMDSGGECGVSTDARFRMPTAESAATISQGWYSIDQGPVHFIMAATELSWAPGSDFHNWLESDLKATDRTLTPWVVMFGHRQMYSAEVSFGEDANLVQVEYLLVQYKVDMSLYGHVHFAELTCPMVNKTCVTEKDAASYDAPIYGVIGNAGQGLMGFGKRPDFDVYEAREFGFNTLEAHNATHLTFNFYADGPIGTAPPLHYSTTLVRKFPRV